MLPPVISKTFTSMGADDGGGEDVAEELLSHESDSGRARSRSRGRGRSGSTGESNRAGDGGVSDDSSDKEDEGDFVLVDVNWLRQWVTGEIPDPHTPSRAKKSTGSKVSD